MLPLNQNSITLQPKTLSQVNVSALEFGNDFRKEVTTTAAVHVTGIGGDLSSGRLTIADTMFNLI